MPDRIGVNHGSLQVAEYVDEASTPTNLCYHRAEVVRPQVVLHYLDDGAEAEREKEFKVLLRDKRVISIQGHGLKYLPNESNPTDHGSYAVLGHSGAREVTVALFRVFEVIGIFSGDMGPMSDTA